MSTEINPSNAITLLYGISGSGKSRQIDEAAEYMWETHQKITRVYVSDLGGWGTKRLSLIKLGIVQVWYFVNHVEPWATAELASLGYWPASFLNAETGLAAAEVALVGPRQIRWELLCPNGHSVAVFDTEATLAQASLSCSICQTMTTSANALSIQKHVIRSEGFANVGLYCYDSLTQLNESGLEIAAERGAGMQEGEALRSPAALREGVFTFGLNAKTHYGFLQQRSRGWIRNIRTIPDQVEKAIVTCGVETGKGDDESGGIPIYGPKIAGNARTSFVPGWAGNCLHATKETLPNGEARHRIWLVNHTDPRDPRAIPYLAKHRGEPIDMPQYLEDAPDQPPFTTCSMKTFYRLEKTQLAAVLARDIAKFPNAPGLAAPMVPEEILESSRATVVLAVPAMQSTAPLGVPRRRGTHPAGMPIAEVPVTTTVQPAMSTGTSRLRRVARPPTV